MRFVLVTRDRKKCWAEGNEGPRGKNGLPGMMGLKGARGTVGDQGINSDKKENARQVLLVQCHKPTGNNVCGRLLMIEIAVRSRYERNVSIVNYYGQNCFYNIMQVKLQIKNSARIYVRENQNFIIQGLSNYAVINRSVFFFFSWFHIMVTKLILHLQDDLRTKALSTHSCSFTIT